MIVRPAQLRPIPGFLLPFTQATTATQTRSFNLYSKVRQIPAPIPFCPDVKTFLSLIGRNLSQHADKIPTWRRLFNLKGEDLKKMGIEPPRARRYLLRRLQQYRQGQYGPGGDLKYIDENGAAEVRLVEVPAPERKLATATTTPGMRKVIVNLPIGSQIDVKSAERLHSIKSVHIKRAGAIAGPHFTPLKGGGAAKIVRVEGLWEQKRGRKIDGGERRAAENRVSICVPSSNPSLTTHAGQEERRGETGCKVEALKITAVQLAQAVYVRTHRGLCRVLMTALRWWLPAIVHPRILSGVPRDLDDMIGIGLHESLYNNENPKSKLFGIWNLELRKVSILTLVAFRHHNQGCFSGRAAPQRKCVGN